MLTLPKTDAIGSARSVSQIFASAFSLLSPHEERAEPAVTAQRLDGVRFEFRVASSAWLTRERSASMRAILVMTVMLVLSACKEDASLQQRAKLERELSSLKYPVRSEVFREHIPPHSKVDRVLSADASSLDAKGRAGGQIVDYWIDQEHVLRVASRYYFRDERHFTMVEWSKVLKVSERDAYTRSLHED